MVKKYKDFIEGIIHGCNFNALEELQTAIDFNRKIPKYYLETIITMKNYASVKQRKKHAEHGRS